MSAAILLPIYFHAINGLASPFSTARSLSWAVLVLEGSGKAATGASGNRTWVIWKCEPMHRVHQEEATCLFLELCELIFNLIFVLISQFASQHFTDLLLERQRSRSIIRAGCTNLLIRPGLLTSPHKFLNLLQASHLLVDFGQYLGTLFESK
jgi:hypothetical protein